MHHSFNDTFSPLLDHVSSSKASSFAASLQRFVNKSHHHAQLYLILHDQLYVVFLQSWTVQELQQLRHKL